VINTRELGKRLIFCAWGIPAGWWIINSTTSIVPKSLGSVLPGQIAAVFLIILACYEYVKMLAVSFQRNGFWLSYLWIVAFLGLDLFGQSMPMKFAIFILLILVAFEAIVWGDKNTGRWKRASLLFSAIVFLYIAGISLLNFYQEPFQSFFRHFSQPMLSQMGIIMIILSVFLCDSGAYFVGSLWGKHRYSTISPNKTIEGSLGGFLVAFIACPLCWHYWGNPKYPWFIGLIMGLLIGISAQAGDLLVSLIKRYFKVKNASELIPGHGGILDRFGSVFFTAPTLGLFFWIVNKFVG
jgi:phosphatidate cytidylyltransferase